MSSKGLSEEGSYGPGPGLSRRLGGPRPGCLPMLPADLTGLPGAPICGQGSLSRPRVLIIPASSSALPPASCLSQPTQPVSCVSKHQPSPGLPLPSITIVQARLPSLPPTAPTPGEPLEPWLPLPEVSLPALLQGPKSDHHSLAMVSLL